MQQDLTIKGDSVQLLYEQFIDGKFVVNRRYQRKLVWTVEEKSQFIDSISHGFPIPLILVAEVSSASERHFEIIDGLQRLEAVMSFIEGKFDLNGKYFDLETIARTKQFRDAGSLKQEQPTLDRELCTSIASYVIPLSIFRFTNPSEVDDVFKRINTNGRHLSSHELRQAGTISLFSELVRRLACQLRGDASHSDVLELRKMQSISISNKGLDYGIRLFEVPWVRYGIVSIPNIRESRDEELIAQLLAYLLVGKELSPSARTLDRLYGFRDRRETNLAEEADDAVRRIGPELAEQQFRKVYDEIIRVLESSGYDKFDRWIFRHTPVSVAKHFQVIFLAFREMLVVRNKKIRDYKALSQRLIAAGDGIIKLKEWNGDWDVKNRQSYIDAVVTHIHDLFVHNDVDDPSAGSGVTRLQNLLTQSKTEQAPYDFKIGFHRLYEGTEFDEDAFSKVMKTLCGMANAGPQASGYVVIGVADSQQAAEQHRKHFRTKGTDKKFNNFWVTGVDNEAAKYKSFDEYFAKIVSRIKHAKITPESVKNQICRDIRKVTYYGKEVIIFHVKSGQEPALYDGKIYERHDSNLHEVPTTGFVDVYRRFK